MFEFSEDVFNSILFRTVFTSASAWKGFYTINPAPVSRLSQVSLQGNRSSQGLQMSLSPTVSGGDKDKEFPGRANRSTWVSVCPVASSQLDGPGAAPLEASSADVPSTSNTSSSVKEQHVRLSASLFFQPWAIAHDQGWE